MNTKAEHTPGPWTLGKGKFTVREESADGYWGFVCRTRIAGDPHRHDDEDHANARLIAQAPELLACLHLCLAAVEERYTNNDADALVARTKEAIAKAEGIQ